MRLICEGLSDLYKQVLEHMLFAEPIDGCKGTSAEVLGASFKIIDPRNNLIATPVRKFNYRYHVAEMLWNAQPTREISYLKQVMPGITRFVEDQPESTRDLVAWAYGFSIWPGFKKCYDELRASPDSRRAVIRVVEHWEMGGTPPCLVSLQFLIRGGKLHAFVQMRSNDVWRGFPLDVYQFSMYQLIMASALGVDVGSYNHDAGSFHLYEADRAAAMQLYETVDYGDVQSTMPDAQFYDQLQDHLVMTCMSDLDYYETMKNVFKRGTGVMPWLAAYHGDLDRASVEFQFLKQMEYGTGW